MRCMSDLMGGVVAVDNLTVLFSTLKHTHCVCMQFYLSEQLFIARFWLSTIVVSLQHWRGWCHMKLLPSWLVLCTPYNHAQGHFMQSHKRKVHAWLAVTCHLHFWQNDQDLSWVGSDAGWKDGAGSDWCSFGFFDYSAVAAWPTQLCETVKDLPQGSRRVVYLLLLICQRHLHCHELKSHQNQQNI